jgi:phosphatidylglycerol:prolipoprotein diacylglycerol transferase
MGAILLWLAWRRGWLKRPGALTGMFFVIYGLSRFAVEFVRQPDAQFVSPATRSASRCSSRPRSA